MEWFFLLAVAFTVVLRKIPVIRIIPGLLFLSLLVPLFLPAPGGLVPPERMEKVFQVLSLRRVGEMLCSYKGDRQDALPERFSQLFPDYLANEDFKVFF